MSFVECNIGKDDVKALTALPALTHLQSLNIGRKGIKGVKVLSSLTLLQTLDVCDNSIGDEGIDCTDTTDIVECILHCISDNGARELAEFNPKESNYRSWKKNSSK